MIEKIRQLYCKHFYENYAEKFKISDDEKIVSFGDFYKHCIACGKTKLIKSR